MNEELDRILARTLSDFRISRGEKDVLRRILDELSPTDQQLALIRQRAFELARGELVGPEALGTIDWLEDLIKILDQDRSPSAAPAPEAYFSPGDDCARVIAGLLGRARRSVDICVFTITDNEISEAIAAAHARQVAVRIISDDEKSTDLGSDVEALQQKGIAVRVDHSRHHMHHKFAIFDRRIVLTGSYNWTRSASENNYENILVLRDPRPARRFVQEFERLWKQYQ